MGFSLKLDERMPVNFGSGFRLSDGERALRFGSVMKPDESKIWDCSPRAPEQREPVKFEAGMVVKWRDTPVARYAIRSVEPDYVRCWRLDRDDPLCGFQISAYGASFELVSPAPRAGDTWTSSESVARIEADGAQLRIVSDGEPFVGDVVAVARKLWEGGCRIAMGAPMHAKSFDEAAVRAAFAASPMPEDPPTALPELRARMVVRREDMAGTMFGVVLSTGDKSTSVKWNRAALDGPSVHDTEYVVRCLRDGRWRIVDPDVRPIASLAYAVAAVCAHERATSRRYVDDALALLRGEPFVDAIRAALVGTAERTNLTPSEIAATIAALRHWEKRRPFDRDLGALQRRTGDVRGSGPWDRLQGEATDVLVRALGYRPVWDYDNLWFLYERARSSRRAPSPVAGRYRSVFSVTSARSSRPL